ncbi:amino acid adenylation domain-containing protein [Pseudomonas entomophila]|uniref:amino acid adenylation domain-containing protein n=1 Tax=Pseudomonas entomophila TaxID=312306 RepID=UPI0024066228|nr:amino acid adenylation domain-containing protein [Pseudomonas entomophila]MDF9618132.1 amino acid adenylation domain-containing protein [Pseudomonas entomophila]
MFQIYSCPLSTAQQEVCLAISQSGRNVNYHLCDVIDLRGDLNLIWLEAAIHGQLLQADALRANFEIDPRSGEYVQRIHATDTLPAKTFQFHDVSDRADPEQGCAELLQHLLGHDMDLQHEPLARYVVVRLGARHHRLVELASHLVVDGFGHGILFGNITAHYNALSRGETLAPHGYAPLASVAEAEQAYRDSPQHDKDRGYWRQYCLKMPEPTQLVPGDAPLVGLNRLRQVFQGETVQRLRHVAGEQSLRLSSILLALCATYLHRMTGQTELAVGMPVAARQLKALRELPSMVANILPLHLSFTAQSTVLTVAANIQRQLRHHLLHQTYRSENMIRDLHAERGNKPLFNTLLNIVAYDQGPGFEGCDTTIQNYANGPAEHLGIDIFDRHQDGRLEIGFNANADLYPDAALALHYQRLVALFERFAEAPDTLAVDYDLFLADEHARFYSLPVAKGALPVFADAFASAVREHAGRVALSEGGRSLRYADLDADATRLAAHLQAQGVKAGDCVVVMFSRSVEWVVAAVALFKLGACYVPVDPDLPPARIEHIFADADPALVIVAPGSQLAVEVAANKLLRLTPEALAQLPQAEQALAPFDASLPAYLIYTSGSTGKPKGVEVTHRNLVSIARTAIEAAHLQPGARVLQFIAAGFDMSVLEIMMTLLAGAQLVITDKVSSAPGKALAKVVRQASIDLLVMTPSLLACHQTEDFPQDTTLMLGGEPCTPALLARFAHCRLLNVYGPTETSFATSINAHYGSGDLSIGPATDNTRLYVVDSQQRLLPPGSWGDLFIGGPGVARGYRNRPDLTAKGFVSDLLDPRGTMYRAGDRVFFDHQGRIHYLGRQDNQVKLRGLRIELDEIKNVLLGCNGVTDATVLLRELRQGPAIVAYVASTDTRLESPQLKQALGRHLPQHMIPSVIMRVDHFPLTPNGKLAVDRLPEPVIAEASELSAAETPEEQAMCALFAEALDCPEVFANQSFFDLGGHSLLGLQLVNRIREQFGVALGIADFLAAPTPRQLAQRLQRNNGYSDPFSAVLALRTEGQRPPLFCIHPGGGIAWPYAGLLAYLPQDQPLYALQSPILLDPERVVGSLEELAREYLQRILALQPQGPYQLAGWSVGGNLALLMAAMLQAQGHEVSFLCMFDSYPLQGGPASLKLDDAMIISRMTRAIVGSPRAGLKGLKSAMEEVLGSQQLGDAFLTRLVDDSKLMLELLGRCQYARYKGDLLFIRATTDILRQDEQQPGLWLPYIDGDLVQVDVEAPHECLLQRQYLDQFGERFVEALLERQAAVAVNEA